MSPAAAASLKVGAINCQHCGAPLRVEPKQRLAACLYCNASCRIDYTDGAPPTITTGALSPSTVREIFQLLHTGQRELAARRCAEELACSAEEAQAILQQLMRQVIWTVASTQRASGRGLAMIVTAVAVLIGAVVGELRGAISVAVAVVLAGAAALFLLNARHLIRNTLRYLGADRAAATVRKRAVIGPIGRGEAVRLWLDVRPDGAGEFQAEVDMAILHESLWKVAEGAPIRVKHRRGELTVVIDALLAREPPPASA